MRGDLTIHALSKNVISYLAKYSDALVGTFYAVDQSDRELLRLILFESEVFGVIELGFYKAVSETVFRQVNESIAISIKSAQDSERIKILLEESKEQASELQSQQEELKAINEELEKQQSSLQKSNEELEYQTKRLRESEKSIRIKNDALEKATQRLERQKRDIELTTSQVENARHELEAKAKELETASKYKSEFLANMSHELRTPLNSLLILSESLAKNEDNNLTEEQIEAAKIIYSGGKDLLNLINDITLNLSKQFNPIAKQKNLQFLVEKDASSLTYIRSDRKHIKQILKNLLSNAFKFTSKGLVTLKIHAPYEHTKFNRKTLKHTNCVGFSVIDTGIGIPADKQAIIFGAFQQIDGSTNRKYAGTGLGLSISKELTKLLTCEIQLESDVGKGSRFTLYAPLSKRKSIDENAQVDNEPSIVTMATSTTTGTSTQDSESINAPFNKASVKSVRQLQDDRDTLIENERCAMIACDSIAFFEKRSHLRIMTL